MKTKVINFRVEPETEKKFKELIAPENISEHLRQYIYRVVRRGRNYEKI
jgi:hypothetical protein